MKRQPKGKRTRRQRIDLFFAIAAGLVAPVVAGMLALSLRAQTPATTSVTGQPKFEVASIKPDKSGRPIQGLKVEPGGRVTAYNVPLRWLISSAYRLTPAQIRMISGAPAWIDSNRFELEAKGEGTFSEDQLVLMLRSLLADRFKLKVHIETRQLPVYALVLAKAGETGPRLIPHTDETKCVPDPRGGGDPASADSIIPSAPCGGIRVLSAGGRIGVGASTTMDILARNLSGLVGRAIMNRTGLSGDYDLALEFTPRTGQPGAVPDGAAIDADSAALPDIFRAIQEQLGLKLVAETGPVDVLVIDHVEEPSPN